MSYRTSKTFVTVDAVIFKITTKTEVLLIKRGRDPFKDHWAIPGGFVYENEDLLLAACRELQEETGLKDVILHQLYTFGAPNRDPRGHMISVSYWGIAESDAKAIANDDAAEAQWFSIYDLPLLAFDHSEIIAMAKEKLK